MDVTGTEFEDLMESLGKLTYVSTPEGAQELMTLISEQAELDAEFKVHCTCTLYPFAARGHIASYEDKFKMLSTQTAV